MKRNLIGTSSLLVLSLMLTTAAAYAQSTVQAYVPFAFKVGQTSMPAGAYRMAKAASGNVIQFINVKTGTSAMTLSRAALASKRSQVMVFHHQGGEYVLAEIWGVEGTPGMTFAAPHQKRELIAAQEVRNADKYVEIALK